MDYIVYLLNSYVEALTSLWPYLETGFMDGNAVKWGPKGRVLIL